MIWTLQDNLQPIQAGAMGNCSACCLRNLDRDKFCKKMRCYDEMTGNVVYWMTKRPGECGEYLMGIPPRDMVDWFNNHSGQDVKKIATEYMRRIYENQK